MEHPSHSEVAALGYRPIPIIPPDAPLSPNSKIQADQRGKIPGKQVANELWAGFDWLHTRPTERGMARWTESGAGVGVVCGESAGVVGLDIDCLDEDAAGLARRVAEARLGVAPVRIGRAPKLLLVFRLDPFSEKVSWRKLSFKLDDDADSERQLVELRGAGQQFVAYGIHPVTNEPYDWPDTDGVLPHISELPVVDEEDIADYFQSLADQVQMRGGVVLQTSTGATGGGVDREGYDQAQLAVSADKLDQLEEAVSYIRNTSDKFPARDDYIKVGCAIKAAFAEDPDRGERVWLDWAYRWEDGAHGDQEPERDWKRMKPPFEIGAPWLVELARADGWKDAHYRFEPVALDAENERPVTEDEVPVSGSGDSQFWSRYVWVEDMERFVDLQDRIMLNRQQFAIRYPHIGKGPFSNDNASTTYLENSAMRRVVRTKTYRPGEPILITERFQPAVNTWSPGPFHSDHPQYGWKEALEAGQIERDDEAVSLYLELAKHLYPDERERNLLLDWLAFQIQNPGVKCGWHPVIGGDQGIGKDSLIAPVLMGLGDQNVTQINPSILAGQWTHWAENKQVVVVQEMNNFERKATMDKMKPYLACPPETIEINVKGLPQYSLPNIVNLIFFTNHRDAVALEKSDRRFGVFWSEAVALSADFFARLWFWIKHEAGAASVCAWLADRDLSGFDALGRAPDTEAKETMRREALPPIEASLAEAIEDQTDLFSRDLLTVREIVQFLRGEGFTGKDANPNRVARALRELKGTAYLDRIRTDSMGQVRVWAIRDGERYESMGAVWLGKTFDKQAKDDSDGKMKRTFRRRGGAGGEDETEE